MTKKPYRAWTGETAEKALWLWGEMVLDTGQRWKDATQDWQRDAFTSILGLPGAPSKRKQQIWVEGPTGCGKDQVIAAVVLAILHFAPPGFRVICYSSDKDRNADVISTTKSFCRRTDDRNEDDGLAPWMGAGVTFVRDAIRNDERDIIIHVEATDGHSASGSRADLYICNEVQSWPNPHGPMVWDEAIARYDKKDHGRFVVLSNAPFTPPGDFRRDERDKAKKRAKRNPWYFLGVKLKDCPWWTPEKIERKRQTVAPHVWRRLYMCIPTDGRGELVDPDIAKAAERAEHSATTEPVPGVQYVHGLDIGISRDHAVHVVCHREPDGRIVLDRLRVWVPKKQEQIDLIAVNDYVDAELRQYRGKLYADPYQAVEMCQRMERAGHDVTQVPFSAENLTKMCAAVRSAYNDRKLILWPDAGLTRVSERMTTSLTRQVLDAEIQETEKGTRIKSKRGAAGHGDQLSALALCLFGLAKEGLPSKAATCGSTSERKSSSRSRRVSDLRSRHTGRYTGPRAKARRSA